MLVPGAAPADVAEGLWILQHHRPYDHSIVVHPDDGTISWPVIQDIQQSIKERLGNKLPIDDILVKVRANVVSSASITSNLSSSLYLRTLVLHFRNI